MANSIIPNLLSKPILDLTPLLTHPLLTEIFLALTLFVGIFLTLWLLSKFFNFKKQSCKNHLIIAIIIASTSFIIRSISLVFSLTDAQKPLINGIAMVVEVILLLILIKKAYNQKWPKTILIWILTYFGKLMIVGIITLIILFFFTTIPQSII